MRCGAIRSMSTSPYVITVDEARTFQTIRGFGASMTESSAWLIRHILSGDDRKRLMRDLFHPVDGIGISRLRQPMGSSDFALNNYTFDDVKSDRTLKHFSIEREETLIAPLLQEAMSHNSALTIMASAWTAPAWMKAPKIWNGGRLRQDMYRTYAEYFVKYVRAYEKCGVSISTVTAQNEPVHAPWTYPGMRMSADEEAGFVRELAKAFDAEGIETEILVHDHNWSTVDRALAALERVRDIPRVIGVAFHGYAGDPDAQQRIHQVSPNAIIELTESSGGTWYEDFDKVLIRDVQKLFIETLRNGASSVLRWNIALNEHNGPRNGATDKCRGLVRIDEESGVAQKTVDYYSLGHFSKFVMSGAQRIFSSEVRNEGVENMAFRNPDGTVVIVLVNEDAIMKSVEIQLSGRAFAVELPGRSVTTGVFRLKNDTVDIWTTTGDQKYLLNL